VSTGRGRQGEIIELTHIWCEDLSRRKQIEKIQPPGGAQVVYGGPIVKVSLLGTLGRWSQGRVLFGTAGYQLRERKSAR